MARRDVTDNVVVKTRGRPGGRVVSIGKEHVAVRRGVERVIHVLKEIVMPAVEYGSSVRGVPYAPENIVIGVGDTHRAGWIGNIS